MAPSWGRCGGRMLLNCCELFCFFFFFAVSLRTLLRTSKCGVPRWFSGSPVCSSDTCLKLLGCLLTCGSLVVNVWLQGLVLAVRPDYPLLEPELQDSLCCLFWVLVTTWKCPSHFPGIVFLLYTSRQKNTRDA